MVLIMLIQILFIIFSIIISGSDIKSGTVPRIAFIIIFPFFFIYKLLLDEEVKFMESFTGFLAGLLIFLIVYFISRRRLGLADVWYSALIGLVLGIWKWYAAIGIACVLGILYICAIKQHKIPFIPFMAMGSIVINIIQGRCL